MPIYEYQCAACGRITERWQKFSEPPLATCPHCGGSLTKLISSCAFHLKGNGWYVTDYRASREAASSAPKSDEAEETPGTKESDQPKEGEESDASPGKFK